MAWLMRSSHTEMAIIYGWSHEEEAMGIDTANTANTEKQCA